MIQTKSPPGNPARFNDILPIEACGHVRTKFQCNPAGFVRRVKLEDTVG